MESFKLESSILRGLHHVWTPSRDFADYVLSSFWLFCAAWLPSLRAKTHVPYSYDRNTTYFLSYLKFSNIFGCKIF